MNVYYSNGRIEQVEENPTDWLKSQGYDREAMQCYSEGNLEIWSRKLRSEWAVYHPRMGVLVEALYAELNQFEADRVVEIVYTTLQVTQSLSRGNRDRTDRNNGTH